MSSFFLPLRSHSLGGIDSSCSLAVCAMVKREEEKNACGCVWESEGRREKGKREGRERKAPPIHEGARRRKPEKAKQEDLYGSREINGRDGKSMRYWWVKIQTCPRVLCLGRNLHVHGKFWLHFEKYGFRLKALLFWKNNNEILLKSFLSVVARLAIIENGYYPVSVLECVVKWVLNSPPSDQSIPLLIMKSETQSTFCFKAKHERDRNDPQIWILCLKPHRNMTTYKPIMPLKFKSIIKSTKPFKGVEMRCHLIHFIPTCKWVP